MEKALYKCFTLLYFTLLYFTMIFYNRDFMKQYHDAPNNKKNTVPGHGLFC